MAQLESGLLVNCQNIRSFQAFVFSFRDLFNKTAFTRGCPLCCIILSNMERQWMQLIYISFCVSHNRFCHVSKVMAFFHLVVFAHPKSHFTPRYLELFFYSSLLFYLEEGNSVTGGLRLTGISARTGRPWQKSLCWILCATWFQVVVCSSNLIQTRVQSKQGELFRAIISER